MINRFKVSPTVTAGAYSANDVVGGLLTFYGFGNGQIQSVRVSDKAAQNVAYFLVLFESVPTTIADNDTFDIADADIVNICAILSLPTANRTAFTDNVVTITTYTKDNGQYIRSVESSGNIYGMLYTTGTPTYAATTDISVVLQADTV